MEWVSNNWFFLLFAALFIGMHIFGFGCGSHGKHGKQERDGHKRHSHTAASDSSTASKGNSSCH